MPYMFGTGPQLPGIPFREFRQRIELLTLDSGSTCNKGDLLIATSTGWKPATTTLAGSSAGQYAVALLAQATAGGTVRAMVEGFVGVNKLVTSAPWYGQAIGTSATAGQVDVVTEANQYGSTTQAGWAMESAASGDLSLGIMLKAA